MDDDATFGGAEAFDWVRRHELMTQSQVAVFATDAQALPETARAALSVVVRVGAADEQRLAVAALRCRGCSVFYTRDGLAVGGPVLQADVFRRTRELLVPAADSLQIGDLLAAVPSREIKLVPGSEALGKWLSKRFGDRWK